VREKQDQLPGEVKKLQKIFLAVSFKTLLPREFVKQV